MSSPWTKARRQPRPTDRLAVHLHASRLSTPAECELSRKTANGSRPSGQSGAQGGALGGEFGDRSGVIGVHDLVHGENVRAYVTTCAGAKRPTAEELIRFARERVGYKAPEEIFFLDGMPLNSSGKVDRMSLQRMAQERLDSHATSQQILPSGSNLQPTDCSMARRPAGDPALQNGDLLGRDLLSLRRHLTTLRSSEQQAPRHCPRRVPGRCRHRARRIATSEGRDSPPHSPYRRDSRCPAASGGKPPSRTMPTQMLHPDNRPPWANRQDMSAAVDSIAAAY